MGGYYESRLTFHFDPREWAVRRYDAHTYFQGLAGAGLRGVDFVALWRRQYLVLIEVKNYADPRAVRPGKAELIQVLEAKFMDTLQGLSTIEAMLERKWFFRITRPGWLRADARRFDWAFWAQAGHLCRQPAQCLAVPWIHAGESLQAGDFPHLPDDFGIILDPAMALAFFEGSMKVE